MHCITGGVTLFPGIQTLSINSEMQYLQCLCSLVPRLSPLAPTKKTLFLSGRGESLGTRLLFMLQELQSIEFIEDSYNLQMLLGMEL